MTTPPPTFFTVNAPPAGTMPPVRIVFDSIAQGMNVDRAVPCALVVIPAPGADRSIFALLEQHAAPIEIAAMCEVVLRYAITNGLADMVFRGLTGGATQSTGVQRDIPLRQSGDDIPPPPPRGL